MKEEINNYVQAYFPALVEIYRCLHQIPELSAQERDTAAFICNELEECGIEFEKGIGGHGVVAKIYGKNPQKRCIAFRAEMDALPIEENTGLDYSSTYENRMHACGHDMNMTVGLGLAFVLHSLREKWEGCVKIIFQPSEEDYLGGAQDMINAGVLKTNGIIPKVQAILAVHASPELALGVVGSKEGAFMASTDEIHLQIIGVGGHAAQKGLYINPIVVASKIIMDLQESFCQENQVLAFGFIEGMGATNVIPEKVNLRGTFRNFDENERQRGYQTIEKIVAQTCDFYQAHYLLDIKKGYPCMVNDPQLTQEVMQAADELLGKSKVLNLPRRMTADDFAYYAQQIPAVSIRIGTTLPLKDGSLPEVKLHTSSFKIDERALEIAVRVTTYSIISIK